MSKHPNKHIQDAIEFAESRGWRIIETGNSSHAYCRLYCPEVSVNGCKISVWGTPGVPENHAKDIIKIVERCTHSK